MKVLIIIMTLFCINTTFANMNEYSKSYLEGGQYMPIQANDELYKICGKFDYYSDISDQAKFIAYNLCETNDECKKRSISIHVKRNTSLANKLFSLKNYNTCITNVSFASRYPTDYGTEFVNYKLTAKSKIILVIDGEEKEDLFVTTANYCEIFVDKINLYRSGYAKYGHPGYGQKFDVYVKLLLNRLDSPVVAVKYFYDKDNNYSYKLDKIADDYYKFTFFLNWATDDGMGSNNVLTGKMAVETIKGTRYLMKNEIHLTKEKWNWYSNIIEPIGAATNINDIPSTRDLGMTDYNPGQCY